jgi:hypothetical protein
MEKETTTVELFSIKKVGEQIQITGESSPEDLVAAFAIVISDSSVFRSVIASAAVMANDEEFLNAFETKGECVAKIQTKGDA